MSVLRLWGVKENMEKKIYLNNPCLCGSEKSIKNDVAEKKIIRDTIMFTIYIDI